jgi:FkbM family methyltransferase
VLAATVKIPKVARWLAQRTLRDRVVVRRLPQGFGARRVYVSPDAALRHLLPGSGGFDPMLLALAHRYVHRKSVVWDIGANVGIFTFAAAAQALEGRVIAVEPDPFLVNLLRRTCKVPSNRDLNIDVVPAAISSDDGVVTLKLAAKGRASNMIDGAANGHEGQDVRDTMTVPTLSLDTLLQHVPAPDLIKVDVEGAERLVLAGARRLLTDVRPILFLEVARANSDSVRELLEAYRYAYYDGSDPTIDGPRLDHCPWITLAKPLD